MRTSPSPDPAGGTNVKDAALVEERRGRIERAAIEVFLRKGYAATTTREVGLKAGLTQGTLYNYIRTKDDILFLVCDRAIARYHEAVATAMAGSDVPRDRLVRAVRAVVRAQYEHRDSIALVLREAHLLDSRSRTALRRRVDTFLEEIVGIVAAGLPPQQRRASVRMLAETITYLPTLFAMRRWRLRGEGPPEDLIDAVVDIVLAALKIEQ